METDTLGESPDRLLSNKCSDESRIEAKLDAILALLPGTVTIPKLKRWGFRCLWCNRYWSLEGPDIPVVAMQSLILSYLNHLHDHLVDPLGSRGGDMGQMIETSIY